METLFDLPESEWEKEWKNMPEFIQGDTAAIKRVIVNFETKEDIKEFNKITGLNVTMRTKGVFFPLKRKRKIKYIEDETPYIHNKQRKMG